MDRREFLANSATLSAASALWAIMRSAEAGGSPSTATADPLLDRVCDLVIPDTDTPGARAVGVARFMSAAMAHGIVGSSAADRANLEALLRDASGGAAFLSLPPDRQLEVLTGVDQAAYAERGSLWSRMKSLVLIGYYTSEAGAARELYYQLVPGRYDPDVPHKPGDRASSNDWTGQRFG
jgi:Gluconate 2-dehydrogenase subunit 3